ncbi:BQ5605_C001g00554 [Microbotryum silenes-dioicae]|uniref:BQ5605_C001g00554 protein n=1 Tax=Microbotryum silenes-dioicae TaxID=796604 RepID=A0A2X0MY26_9BASI|nr:BQ5605_C001g00554 [Microbotryum silenes-dioicae]
MAPPCGSTPVASQDLDDEDPSLNLTLADAFKPKLERRQQRRDQLAQQIAPLARAHKNEVNAILDKMKAELQGEKDAFEERERRFGEEEKRLKGELMRLSERMQEDMSASIGRVHQILADDEKYMAQFAANIQTIVKAEQEEVERRVQECWFVQADPQAEGAGLQTGDRQRKNTPAPARGQ